MIDSFSGDYRFLSNFYPCDVEYEGIIYKSTEAAYQAAKTLDGHERIFISQLTPGKAKKFGSKLALRKGWDDMKIGVMMELLQKKFRDPNLLRKLLLTRGQELIEGNTWHDNFWGSCTCKGCGNKGQNILGRLLMEVRRG